jgi:hypothetical protein
VSAAPENVQRIYLRGGLDGDPLSFSIRWFVPAGFDANGAGEIESGAAGQAELTSCLTLLGVSALAVMVGDVIDGTPVFETRPCTPAAAAEHVARQGARAHGIAYPQTLYVDATPEEVLRRLRLWDSSRRRWSQ